MDDSIKRAGLVIGGVILGAFLFNFLNDNHVVNPSPTVSSTKNHETIINRNGETIQESNLVNLDKSHLKKLATKDSIINILRRQIKEISMTQGTAVNIVHHNVFDTTVSIGTLRPEGECDFFKKVPLQGGWGSVTCNLRKDSLRVAAEFKNSYSLLLGEKKTGLFKRERFIQVTHHNPYVKNPVVTSFDYEQDLKKKRFGVGPQLGVTYSNKEFTPYIGVGIQYSIFYF